MAPGNLDGKFDYSQSNLGSLGRKLITFGVIGVALIIAVAFDLYKMHISGPVLAPLAILFVWFLAWSVGFLILGKVYLDARRNEAIEVSRNNVRWVDRKGQTLLEFTLDQVRSVHEKNLPQPGPGARSAQGQHLKCEVATDAGLLVFSDNISDYEKLRDFFTQLAPE